MRVPAGPTAVMLVAVLVGGTSVPTPLWPYYQRSFGFSTLTLTLVFSVYMAALLPALLAGPRLCRRARPAVAAAGCAAIGAAVTFALATSVADLILARALQGMAVGLSSPALAGIVRGHSRTDQAAGLRAGTAATAGGGTGALLAGLAARYGPYPSQLPFAVLGAVTAIASTAVIGTAGGDTPPARPAAATTATAAGGCTGTTRRRGRAAAGRDHHRGLGLCFATAARTVFGLARAFGGGLLTAWYASTYLGVGSAVVGVGLLSTVTSLTGSVRAIAATVTAATIGWLAAALGGRPSRRS